MKTNPVFGGTSTVLLASFSQSDTNQSWCWRTCQTSFDWGDETWSQALPKSGMIANGQLYQQDNVEHPMCANDGSALPTPTASDAGPATILNENTNIVFTSKGTPRKVSNNGVNGSLGLARTVMLLPTPTVNESKNNPSGASQWDRRDSLNVEAAKLNGLNKTTGKDFQLNPQFVEEMMGFPIGWTVSKHLETQLSPSAQNGSDNK